MKFSLNTSEHFFLGPYKVTFRIVRAGNQSAIRQPHAARCDAKQLVELIIQNPCGILGNDLIKIVPLNNSNVFQGYHIRLLNANEIQQQTNCKDGQSIRLEVLMPAVKDEIKVVVNAPVVVNNRMPNAAERLMHCGKFNHFVSLLNQCNVMPVLVRYQGAMTILAPTDQAMRKFECRYPGMWSNLDHATMCKILMYHIMLRPMSTNQLNVNTPAMVTQTMQGENVVVQLAPVAGAVTGTGTAPVVVAAQNAPVDMSVANMTIANGMIQGINGILLPPSMKANLQQYRDGAAVMVAMNNQPMPSPAGAVVVATPPTPAVVVVSATATSTRTSTSVGGILGFFQGAINFIGQLGARAVTDTTGRPITNPTAAMVVVSANNTGNNAAPIIAPVVTIPVIATGTSTGTGVVVTLPVVITTPPATSTGTIFINVPVKSEIRHPEQHHHQYRHDDDCDDDSSDSDDSCDSSDSDDSCDDDDSSDSDDSCDDQHGRRHHGGY